MAGVPAQLLSWIKTEVDFALKLVRDSIAKFSAAPDDAAVLKVCPSQLHQVSGALRIVGLAGATRFCEAIEGTFSGVISARPTRSAVETVDRAVAARDVIRAAVRPGRTGDELFGIVSAHLEEAGFSMIEFNQPTDRDVTDVVFGMHSVGNTGHGIGPAIDFFSPPLLRALEVWPNTLISLEFFAYTPVPEWGGAKARIPFEDDVVVTERGLEWLHPPVDRILLIR